MRSWLIALLLLAAPAALAAPLENVSGALQRNDVPTALRMLDDLGAEHARDPQQRAMLARALFYDGDFPGAYDHLKAATELGYRDRHEDLALYERTLFATANWVEETHGRFAIRFRPGVDAILMDDARFALERAERHLAPLMGGPPPGTTRLELYPTERSFIAASSLMKEDVATTGVVALSKWSRLLVVSPRTMPRGYDWQDTIAHEYIHLVVAHHTSNEAPVWLQEAIAKYLDNRWRDGRDAFRLTVRQQGLLATALRKQDLVTFEEMHPSLAKLPTAERAALAYAQLATLMAYCFEQGGPDVLLRTLPEVGRGTDPREALAVAAGAKDFAELEAGWRAWLEALELSGDVLREPPTVLDGGDAMDLDPVLAERHDLQDFVVVGQELYDIGEVEAALVEFGKAVPEGAPPSPILSNLMAQAHIELGNLSSATSLLEASLRDYPEFALSHKTLGALRHKEGRLADALVSTRHAANLNPFDPEVQDRLARLYEAAGDDASAERHRAYLKIRRQGGDDVVRPVLHTREGTYELPSDKHRTAVQVDEYRFRWVGETVPSWNAVRTNGKALQGDDYAGRVVVLDFWATWCGPCKKAMPELSALYDEHKRQGLEVVGLSDEQPGRVRGFLERNEVSYTIGVEDGSVREAFEVAALPTAFVVDREGRIAEVVVGGGGTTMERIRAAVLEALEDK